MKKSAIRIFAVLLCIWILSVGVYATEYLVPVGQVIGMELQDGRLCVAAFDEKLGQNAQKAGLCQGDQILAIDGKNVSCPEDISKALTESKGNITMTICRNGKKMQLKMAPTITPDGPKLGIYLKRGITGIGTVTYYDPETGDFGALGHGVSGSDGKLAFMAAGTVYRAGIAVVKAGKVGEPGQLRGTVTQRQPLGKLAKNTPQGVFGTIQEAFSGEAIPVATAEEIHTGSATILSTVSGETVREYSVEILKIYPRNKQEGRNLMLRITDPALLEVTGGIVQGMSGSPIIQDGKLVGAVTHVLVNDPTRGYGIFIENMLDAAS